MRAFITCDGEAKQIEVFQEQDIIDLLKENLIDLGKTPASCSAICQSSDVSSFFKAAKKRLRFTCSNKAHKVDLKKTDIGIFLTEEVFSQREKMPDAMKSKLIDGLQYIAATIQDTLKPSMIREGYESIGQYPIDFDKAMSHVSRKHPISIAQMEHMRATEGDMIAIYRARGNVTETDMDELGIMTVNDGGRRRKPKHLRVLHQQRAVIMNSEDCIAKFKIYKTQEELNKEATALRKAQRKAASDLKKAQEAEAKAAHKKQKADYHAWKATLTKEQKKVENARFKIEKTYIINA